MGSLLATNHSAIRGGERFSQWRIGRANILTVSGRVSLVLCLSLILFSLQGIGVQMSAAQTSAAEVDFRGPIPKSPMKHSSGKNVYGLVVVDDVQFLSGPGGFADELQDKPQFLEGVVAYREVGGSHYLVHNDRVGWGWIARQDVLLRMRSLIGAERDRAKGKTVGCDSASPIGLVRPRSGENPNLLKVVVKNDWRSHDDTAIEPIPLLKGPDANRYGEVGRVNVFRVRYTYKICEGTRRDGKSTHFLLVGNHPVWNWDYPNISLTGWIDIKDVILWDTRVGVWYDEVTRPNRESAIIFQDESSLRNYGKTGEVERALARENEESPELKYFMTRYPVLSDAGDYIWVAWISGAVQGPPGTEEEKEKANEGAVSGKNSSSGVGLAANKPVINKEEIERRVVTISETIDDVRNRDILFVLDATSSMGDYFEVARRAINEFIDGLSAEKRRRYRFAVAIYRDYVHTSGDFELISDFSSQNVMSRLDAQLAAEDGGDHSIEEGMFNGIIKAVGSVTWGDRHTRAVVVVGDHGNHTGSKSKYSTSDVVEALKKNRIIFHAINVMPRPKFKAYNALFREQAKEIINLNQDRGTLSTSIQSVAQRQYNNSRMQETEDLTHSFGSIGSASGTSVYDDLTRSRARIVDALDHVDNFTDRLGYAFQTVVEGQKTLSELRNEYGTVLTDYMLEVMRAEGLTEEQISLRRHHQIVEAGWVRKFSRGSGIPQLAPWVLVRRTDLATMANFLTELKGSLLTPEGGELKKVIASVLYRITGDKLRYDERISEYIGRAMHVPFRNVSGFLQYTAEELVEKWEGDRQFRTDLRNFLCEKTTRLTLIIQDSEGVIESTEGGACRTTRSFAKKWWWTPGGDEKYAWIPMHYLP